MASRAALVAAETRQSTLETTPTMRTGEPPATRPRRRPERATPTLVAAHADYKSPSTDAVEESSTCGLIKATNHFLPSARRNGPPEDVDGVHGSSKSQKYFRASNTRGGGFGPVGSRHSYDPVRARRFVAVSRNTHCRFCQNFGKTGWQAPGVGTRNSEKARHGTGGRCCCVGGPYQAGGCLPDGSSLSFCIGRARRGTIDDKRSGNFSGQTKNGHSCPSCSGSRRAHFLSTQSHSVSG